MAKTIVCPCEDITLRELYTALAQGYREIESLKRYTGIATGKCQGKCCIVQTLRVLSSREGKRWIERGTRNGPGEPLAPLTPEEVDALVRIPTIRQPVTPMSIDEIVDAGGGEEAEHE